MEAKENKIEIGGKEYAVDQNRKLKAMLIFEQLREKLFELKDLTDNVTYMFSIVLASNPGANIDFDDFILALENPDTMKALNEMVGGKSTLEAIATASNDEENTDKKKD